MSCYDGVRRIGRIAFMLAAVALTGCGVPIGGGAPLEVVERVDVERYTGKWYEIARYPNWFQSSCASSTADYAANDDGTIRVFNTCLAADGGVNSTIQGTARVADPSTNAKLKVTFPGIPFPADYWIVQLGANYEYAVVGEPTRTNLFILSRTPTLDEDTLNAILTELVNQGYDPARLIYDKVLAVP